MKKKTILTLLAAAVLATGGIATVGAMSTDRYKDVQTDDSFYSAVEDMTDFGIMDGQEDDTKVFGIEQSALISLPICTKPSTPRTYPEHPHLPILPIGKTRKKMRSSGRNRTISSMVWPMISSMKTPLTPKKISPEKKPPSCCTT